MCTLGIVMINKEHLQHISKNHLRLIVQRVVHKEVFLVAAYGRSNYQHFLTSYCRIFCNYWSIKCSAIHRGIIRKTCMSQWAASRRQKDVVSLVHFVNNCRGLSCKTKHSLHPKSVPNHNFTLRGSMKDIRNLLNVSFLFFSFMLTGVLLIAS